MCTSNRVPLIKKFKKHWANTLITGVLTDMMCAMLVVSIDLMIFKPAIASSDNRTRIGPARIRGDPRGEMTITRRTALRSNGVRYVEDSIQPTFYQKHLFFPAFSNRSVFYDAPRACTALNGNTATSTY
jgi:hypothetical protein|uniref:Uncharacterized protein n=1 Tax=Sipha flava TaxID=143950 RepID=A0A2S2Q1M3_9HEMI